MRKFKPGDKVLVPKGESNISNWMSESPCIDENLIVHGSIGLDEGNPLGIGTIVKASNDHYLVAVKTKFSVMLGSPRSRDSKKPVQLIWKGSDLTLHEARSSELDNNLFDIDDL